MLLISFLILICICCKSTINAQGYPPRKSPPPPPPPPPPQPPSNTYLPTGGGASGGGNGDDFMPSGPPIPIIRMMAKLNLDGSYNYEYETGNGITVMETAMFTKSGDGHPIKTATGFFSYTSPEGKDITVNYIADENGFQPSGDHLPTPPPVPPEIQELIDNIGAGGGCDGMESDGGSPGNGAMDPKNGGYVY